MQLSINKNILQRASCIVRRASLFVLRYSDLFILPNPSQSEYVINHSNCACHYYYVSPSLPLSVTATATYPDHTLHSPRSFAHIISYHLTISYQSSFLFSLLLPLFLAFFLSSSLSNSRASLSFLAFWKINNPHSHCLSSLISRSRACLSLKYK